MPELKGYQYIYEEPKTKDAPIFLVLHGTGGNEKNLLPFINNVDPEAGVLSVRGNVIDNSQTRYFKYPVGDVFDEEDIAINAKSLVQFANEASQQHHFERNKLIWLGYSNGANMITAIMYLHPAVVQKAVLLRPMVVLTPNPIPVLPETSILMASGRQDPIVPEENMQKLIHILQQTGAIVELYLHTGGHELDTGDVVVTRDWYQKHTGRHVETDIASDTDLPEEEPDEDETKPLPVRVQKGDIDTESSGNTADFGNSPSVSAGGADGGSD
jgi:phospholipase/carboxylesterase